MEQPHFLRLHYCSLKDSGYEQNKNVVWSQGFFFHILNQLNGMLDLPQPLFNRLVDESC